MKNSLLALGIAAALVAAPSAQAAKVKLINKDAPGVGLNDTTPVAPIGGNPGTTRGEQATIVYKFAMDMWGGVLESDSDIKVYASFAPLTCTSTTGTLASAGANWTFNLTDDDGKMRRYGSALADAVVGFDVFQYFLERGGIPAGYEDDEGDIVSRFNGSLGQPGCLDGMSWYFGLDGRTPTGKVNFLNTVMHELGHGLGFQGFLNKTTGALNGGLSDPYTYYAYDNVLNKGFEAMTNAERATAMKTVGRTVWRGPNVYAEAPLALTRANGLVPSAPSAIAGQSFEIGTAAFGPLATPSTFIDREIVLIDDGDTTGGGTLTDGCSAKGSTTSAGDTITYVNQAAVAGKIALIDRGTCSFEYKTKIAQDNGAVAVIIANNAAGVIDMGVATPATNAVTIPTVMVSQADGAKLKANPGARAGVKLSNLLAGADSLGRVRLYSPTTVATGSTFSHFDTALYPDALMEPFDSISVKANYDADLSAALFKDIGWEINPRNGNFAACDTGVPAVEKGGAVIGANLQAASEMCKATSANRNGYVSCMNKHRDSMLADGALTSKEAMKVNTCVKKMSDNYGRY